MPAPLRRRGRLLIATLLTTATVATTACGVAGGAASGAPSAAATTTTAVTASAARPAGPHSPTVPKAGPVSLFVLGDSYVSGTAQNKGRPWQELLASRKHYALDWDGEGGTGYVKNDPTYGPHYLKRLKPDLARPIGAHGPTFMVVAGGANDRYLPPSRVAAAAQLLFKRIHHLTPTSELVVISPWVPISSTYVPKLDAALRAVTLAAHGVWIDSHTWFVNHPDLIGTDHDHPTEAGHRFIATKVGHVLVRQLARR